MLILVLAANTSFADFPRLASFHAGDNFMPRQLTKRGHRLVFSNGIIFLAVTAIVLLIVTGAKVDRLIPLYAIGVFTSFTLSQAGMAKHHIREKEQGWRWGLFVNGMGAVLSLVVDIIIAVTKFRPRRMGDRRARARSWCSSSCGWRSSTSERTPRSSTTYRRLLPRPCAVAWS